MFVDDSSYACLHLHKRIVLTMSNKTAVKCSDVRYNFAKSICMHLLWDMYKDITMTLPTERERERERWREMRLNFLCIVMKYDQKRCIYVLMHFVDNLVKQLITFSLCR